MQQPKFPSIVHHKARNADVVFLRGPDGVRRQVCLGPHGSPEAQQRYREVVAAHLAGAGPRHPEAVERHLEKVRSKRAAAASRVEGLRAAAQVEVSQ